MRVTEKTIILKNEYLVSHHFRSSSLCRSNRRMVHANMQTEALQTDSIYTYTILLQHKPYPLFNLGSCFFGLLLPFKPNPSRFFYEVFTSFLSSILCNARLFICLFIFKKSQEVAVLNHQYFYFTNTRKLHCFIAVKALVQRKLICI